MVKIIDFKTYQNDDGEDYNMLILQSGIQSVKSQESGRIYFTTCTARVPCTFNDEMCKSLLGTELPGRIEKVETEPYDFSIPHSDEVVQLSHRFEYISEQAEVLKDNVVKHGELVL